MSDNNEKKPVYKKVWFWILVIFFWIVIMSAVTSNKDNNNVTTSTNTTETAVEAETVQEPVISKEDYQAQCKEYSYKELARNPNQYKGEKVKFTGKVIQVQESWGNSVILRVDVTKDEYGLWDDTIYVDYKYKDENESKILDDDIISIYGEFKGQKTYATVLGSSMSIPQIEAQYIELSH